MQDRLQPLFMRHDVSQNLGKGGSWLLLFTVGGAEQDATVRHARSTRSTAVYQFKIGQKFADKSG